jgi:hypothetical protein
MQRLWTFCARSGIIYENHQAKALKGKVNRQKSYRERRSPAASLLARSLVEIHP